MGRTESTAFVGGRIFTGRRFVEALVATGGRVVTAGTSAAVRRDRPTGATTVDLGGRWLMPGMIDAHLHLAGSVVAAAGTDLRGTRSREELGERLSCDTSQDPAAPRIARGWDETPWADRGYPARELLDQWEPRVPLVLYRVCGHIAVVNSSALERLRLDDGSPDPSRGWLGRSGGRLTGALYEGALDLLQPLMDEAYSASKVGIRAFLRSLRRAGLTTVAPMSARPGEADSAVTAMHPDDLPVRLRPYLSLEGATRSRDTGDPGGLLRVAGVKLFSDGSLGARTAWLSEPYSDAPGTCGTPTLGREQLVAALERANELGQPVAVHAIGDAAVSRVLAALAEVRTRGTPRIEHASVTPPSLIGRLREVRPTLVVQPRFIASDLWLEDRLGPERARWAYAFRSLISAGVTLAGSSDAPVEPFDPWTGLAAATAPRRWAPSERLDPVRATGLYTTGAATALGEPGLGNLEPGAWADALVVRGPTWEQIISHGPKGVEATYVGAEPESPAAQPETILPQRG